MAVLEKNMERRMIVPLLLNNIALAGREFVGIGSSMLKNNLRVFKFLMELIKSDMALDNQIIRSETINNNR
jgi:hypothetical protein